MKTFARIFIAAISVVAITSACQKIEKKTVYTANVPQYMSYDNLRNAVYNDNSQTLEKPGKIFLSNHWILINDFEKGIHIYDNRNPSSPQHLAFINIPGNVDIAVKDNTLYADSYTDLVAIDISDPTHIREVGRLENALSYTIPSSMDLNYPVAKIDPEKGVVVGYKVEEVEETCQNKDCKAYYQDDMAEWGGSWNGGMMSDQGTPVSFSGNSTNVRSANSSNNSAIAGSMARFMKIDQYLYVISDENTIKVIDIRSNNMMETRSFRPWEDANGWGMIETLFTFKEHLFIGSNAGMLAYDISSPQNPRFLSSYDHMTSCDPVVANDNYAFITLKGNTGCSWNNESQLEVLDINNIMDPFLIFTELMTDPHGLDIDSDNNLLFVCDGTSGLRVYDFAGLYDSGPNIVELQTIAGFDTYDVILSNGIAHVIGADGLKQFSYGDRGETVELSTIPLN